MTNLRISAMKIAASVAFCTIVALTVSVSPAHADERRDGYHDEHQDRSNHRDDRDGDHQDRGRHRDDHRDHGYYAPPPVVYGAGYYAPPPVVYGPAIGISLPAIVIGIH